MATRGSGSDRGPEFPPLPAGPFGVLYADPPWDYRGQLQHAGPGSGDTGGAVRHYPTVTSADLARLPIREIAAEDCLLFLWATNPHLDQALELGKAWGFRWATVAFVWDKERVNPGFYTLSQCELCLVFKRGRIPLPRGSRNERQLVRAPRGPHSTKPEEVRRRIERMFPEQPRIELFARRRVPGWTAWGLEMLEKVLERDAPAATDPADRHGSAKDRARSTPKRRQRPRPATHHIAPDPRAPGAGPPPLQRGSPRR